MKKFLLPLLLGSALSLHANPLPNPGFEDGTAQWAVADGESQVVADAARTGKLGLRVGKMEYYPSGASVFSSRFPVVAGQEVAMSFWARSKVANCGVYFWFYDANAKLAGQAIICPVKNSEGEWRQYSHKARAPEGAVSVALWIHTYAGATGLVDFDDFTLTGFADGVVATAPPPPRAKPQQKAVKNVTPEEIPAREKPPLVVLKLDDVKQMNGNIHGRWRRVADYLESKKIKGGFGVICETLADAKPAYVQWITERRKAGFVEFWFHAYDHATHLVDGERFNEFNKRSYEEQKERVSKSQTLAKEKLGFAFTSFGPPGGVGSASFNADTLRVMAEDPDITTMMYPQPFNDIGREYHDSGRLTILDRIWAVGLEGGVGVPDFQRFLNGYAENTKRGYFVLQGHPASWDDARFAQFERIVDFLISQKAVFMTPSELGAWAREQQAAK